jgi:4'-phosphopantetheinyl transferase
MDVGPCRLRVDCVHVWYVFSDRVTDAKTLERYARMMSLEERVRHDRFVFARDRHQFLVARGFTRTLLSRYTGIDPDACLFIRNRYGKPSLHDVTLRRAGVEFNLSHTNGLVAIAIASGVELGIDVEDMSRAVVEADVEGYFSAAEVETLQALEGGARRSRFFDYWTLKEAYIKARGMGLFIPLDSFSMHLDGDRPPTISFAPGVEDDPAAWQFAQFDPSPHHRLALAIHRRGSDVPVWVGELHPTR